MIVSSVSTSKMDEVDAVSLASAKMKDDGLRATAYSLTSEPPPFYKERVSTSVRIARLVAATVVAVAFILGAAIILAAYLQSRTETSHHFQNEHVNAAALNQSAAALAAAAVAAVEARATDMPAGSSTDDTGKKSGHRRLDAESDDLLEAFLENEGKILRLPVEDNSQIDISDLAKMFLKRNQPRKTQCFIEKRRLGAGDVDNVKEEVVTMVPIQLNEAILRDSIANSGQRVSIICNTDSSDAPTERSVRIQGGSIPISMTMPRAMMIQGPIQSAPFPIRSDSVSFSGLPPTGQMHPPPPPSPPSSPMFAPMDHSMHLPSIPMRAFFPQERFGAGPFRFPIRPMASGQWQRSMPFPQVPQHRSIFRVPEPVRPNFLPFEESPDDYPDFKIPQRLIHTPNFRNSRPPSEESEESEESIEVEEDPAVPLSRFRVPLPVTTASPEAVKIPSRVLTPPAESGDVPSPDQSLPVTMQKPDTLPFLHVPKRVAMRRPSGRNPEADDAAKKDFQPEHRSGSVTLFERLMDSLIGGGVRKSASPDANADPDADAGNSDEAKGIVVAVPIHPDPSEPSGAPRARGSNPVPFGAAPIPSGTISAMNLLLRSPLLLNLSGRNGGGPSRRIDPLIARGMRLPLDAPNHFHNIHTIRGIHPVRRPIDGLSPQLNRFDPRAGSQGPSHSIQPRSLTED